MVTWTMRWRPRCPRCSVAVRDDLILRASPARVGVLEDVLGTEITCHACDHVVLVDRTTVWVPRVRGTDPEDPAASSTPAPPEGSASAAETAPA